MGCELLVQPLRGVFRSFDREPARRVACGNQVGMQSTLESGHTRQNLSATATATSPYPEDWGRALACAVSQLARICAAENLGGAEESLMGRELSLTINPVPTGAQITVGLAPDPRT